MGSDIFLTLSKDRLYLLLESSIPQIVYQLGFFAIALWLSCPLLARFTHGLQKVTRSRNGICAVLIRTVARVKQPVARVNQPVAQTVAMKGKDCAISRG